ncbi:MAG: UDP-N-acetylglucosamine--LPS N-acetylglucosamine transferase, partial [Verrucomicrobiota bacterium]
MNPILIFTAGYGEGHNTAAYNIAAAVKYLGGIAEVVDPFQKTYGRLNDLVKKLYIFSINRTPGLWQLFYNTLDQNPKSVDRLSEFKGLARVIKKLIDDKKPGAVISSYPVYNFLLRDIFGEGKSPFHQATMVTDSISINALWYLGYSDRYYVPNPDTAKIFYNQQIPEEKVTVSGFPVQLDFALPDRRSNPADLHVNQPEILYVVNSGKQKAPAVVSRLLKKSDWKITVAVGRDKGLRDHISRIVEPWSERARVLGWTKEMPQLLMTHHLL